MDRSIPDARGPEQSRSLPGLSELPTVSIIVVNYNGGEHLRRCLESLVNDSYPNPEIIVLDNASSDESLAAATSSQKYPDITFIRSSRNLGYAGGINHVLSSATGEYVAVLNMDVTVEAGWLKPLVQFLEEHKHVGAVNPLITLADGLNINAGGQNIHITGLGFNRWLGRAVNTVKRTPLRIPGIQGSAFVTSRALLELIGGMDEDGFLYHEDVNFSWLLRMMGFELYCLPESVVRHHYLLSMYPLKLFLLERNRWSMLLAYLNKTTLLCLMPALILTEVLMWGFCVLRGRKFVRAKAGSYLWLLRRRQPIKRRRELAKSLRKLTDWEVLKTMRWSYPWDQLFALGRERGRSLRENVGPLPEGERDLV